MKIQKHRQPSADCIAAARAYVTARAYAETLKPVIDKIKNEVFSGFTFHVKPEWQERTLGEKGISADYRITEPEAIYLTDLDAPEVQRYWQALHEVYKARGFDVREVGNCPWAVAKNLQIKAENLLLDTMADWSGLPELRAKEIWSLEDRQKAIDLHTRFLARYL